MIVKSTKSVRLIVDISVILAMVIVITLFSWFSYARLLRGSRVNEPDMPSSFFVFVLQLLLPMLLTTILIYSLTTISFILCIRRIKKIESSGSTIKSATAVALFLLTLFLSHVVGYTGDGQGYKSARSWIFLAGVNLLIWVAALLIKLKQGYYRYTHK